jgi:hypothetical protein
MDASHSCRSAASRACSSGSMAPVVLSAPNTGLRQPQEHTACTAPSPSSRSVIWWFTLDGFLPTDDQAGQRPVPPSSACPARTVACPSGRESRPRAIEAERRSDARRRTRESVNGRHAPRLDRVPPTIGVSDSPPRTIKCGSPLGGVEPDPGHRRAARSDRGMSGSVFAGSRPASMRISRRRVATCSRTIQYETTPAALRSFRSRSEIRFAVCRCLQGVSRSSRSPVSITSRYGSTRELRFGGFRDVGQAEPNAGQRCGTRPCASMPGSTSRCVHHAGSRRKAGAGLARRHGAPDRAATRTCGGRDRLAEVG